MAAVEMDKAEVSGPGACNPGKSSSEEPLCWGGGSKGGCGHCQGGDVTSGGKRVGIGQVLLVFFLPLACAVTLVIAALRYLPRLAEHPGYLVLSALGVGTLAIVVGRIVTRGSRGQSEGN